MRAWALIPVVAAGLGGCLPSDTRPPPAEILVTVSGSELTRNGIERELTVDGFEISFDRLLVNLGGIEVGGNNQVAGCSEYSDPGYTRLFDFTEVETPQKLGLAYGLGHCPFGYVVRSPNVNSIVGTGANDQDHDFMRTPGSDRLAKDAGVSVFVAGRAARGDEIKHFSWAFRKRVGYRACFVEDGDEKISGLELTSGGSTGVNIEIQGEALFRPGLEPALLHFEPYARADADADGEITLDELSTISIEELVADGLYLPRMDEQPEPGAPEPDAQFGCWDEERAPVKTQTLGDYAYCTLLPRIARFQGNGACTNLVGRPPEDED
jgi:hypothetical protein